MFEEFEAIVVRLNLVGKRRILSAANLSIGVRMMRLLMASVLAVVAPPNAAKAKNELPPNVSTKLFADTKNKVIDAIDYSFSTEKPVDFSRMKMCIATNISNDEVQLSDSGGYSSTVQGGGLFKYVDDASKSLVARGSVSRQAGLGGIIGISIRFDLEMTVEGSAVKMRMYHIEQAQKNTGSISNNGYGPIGVWTGSMYKKHILALDQEADQIKSCVIG